MVVAMAGALCLASLAACGPAPEEEELLESGSERTESAAAGGLSAEYFDDVGLTSLRLTRVDPVVDFDWGTGSPAAALQPDTFSVRWSGTVTSLNSESHTFSVRSDDGVRLWVFTFNGTILPYIESVQGKQLNTACPANLVQLRGGCAP